MVDDSDICDVICLHLIKWWMTGHYLSKCNGLSYVLLLLLLDNYYDTVYCCAHAE